MADVMIPMSEAAATRFLNKAQELQVSISVLMEQISLDLNFKKTVAESFFSEERDGNDDKKTRLGSVSSSPWVEKILEMVRNLPEGTEFSLGTLLKDHWNELPEPRVLGRMVAMQFDKQGLAIRDGDLEAPGMAKMARYVRV